MAEKDNTVKVLITTFIVALLALSFVVSIATQTNTVTTTTTTSDSFNLSSLGCYQGGQVNGTTDVNCNLTVTNVPSGWQVEDCPLTGVVVTNKTGTALTVNSDYKVFATTGIVQMLNTTSTNSTNLGSISNVTYNYCGTGYVNSSWGRTILGVNVGLYAIAILILAVGAAYILLRKESGDYD